MRQRNGKGKPTSSSSVAKKLIDNLTKREREKKRITSQPRLRTACVDLELASVKRGTISCPNASEKKSTQGTSANIFSTQIGYSNYPRLFNLATRLQALFQVRPQSRDWRVWVGGGRSGGKGWQSFPPLHHFVRDGRKKKTASACRTDDSGRDSVLFKG